MAPRGYRGRWLLVGPPDEAPVRDGAVVFDDAGRVVAVGQGDRLQADHPDVAFRTLDALLMPGLVNAHVHLELSALRGQTRGSGGFGPWAASMMAARERLLPEQDFEAIDAAVGELLRSGTVAVGEVTNSLAAVDALSTAPLLGRVFHEVFGLRRETAGAMRQAARQAREQRRQWPANLSYAPSPHTLFSLHPAAVRQLCDESREQGQRASLHLAEHAAERAFLKNGTGPLKAFFDARGADPPDWEPPGQDPVAYAEALGVLREDVICVHLCDTGPEALGRVARAAAPAVLCPRSNLYIELKLPPLQDILEAGLEPGLGTDSLASNTTLDVLAEAVALRDRFPWVEPERLLGMATWFGARALGLSHRVGALMPGLTPGLLAFEGDPDDAPAAWLLRHASTLKRQVLERPAAPAEGETL